MTPFPLFQRPVFVTGAGGLIGSAVCRALAARGVPACALLAPQESDENIRDIPGIEIVRGDVRDAARMRELMAGMGACIHAAALNRLWHRPHRDLYDINVCGTENVCRAAQEANVARFVFISSCEVMGPARCGPPADERRPLDGRRVRGHYEQSKFLAEELVHQHAAAGLPAVILRPTAVLGPGDIHGTPPGRLVRAFLERAIRAYYDMGINIIDSRDVAAAHVAALTRGNPGETYILGGHNLRLSELFDLLQKTSGVRAPARRVGFWSASAAAAFLELKARLFGGEPGITRSGIRTVRYPWHFDAEKARWELGLAPRPLEETIRDAVRWHRADMMKHETRRRHCEEQRDEAISQEIEEIASLRSQ